jgi:hypothetical protein
MIEDVRVTRNRRTGQIDKNTPVHLIEHPVLGRDLEIVDDDAKPLVPELININRAKPEAKPPVTDEDKDKA